MKFVLPAVSYLALATIFVSTLSYLFGAIDRDLLERSLLTATIAWFATAPCWMGRSNA
ncbi:hypothetical protein [Pelagicoccus sp. SDUM812003]|uniref:hypothetical protein n=1 Tax=Pelagicoccus sp. SDUM812003 TaxID=3041267 RepID=UPI00280E74B0|nr:hypothetical protein [Pelagicoccus sp. SDUM812003]MDQ8203227.1 hypothetical protein [Pelagicoccus sp. SDUM812003]